MKSFLFDLYKILFIHINKELSEKETPNFIARLTTCTFVLLFIGILSTCIYIPYRLIFHVPTFKLNKAIMWPCMIFGNFLVYLLLFKVLKLENHNYLDPEHRPSSAVIKRTWRIVLAVTIIMVILLIIKMVIVGG
mgnify:CR=1 FL=1